MKKIFLTILLFLSYMVSLFGQYRGQSVPVNRSPLETAVFLTMKMEKGQIPQPRSSKVVRVTGGDILSFTFSKGRLTVVLERPAASLLHSLVRVSLGGVLLMEAGTGVPSSFTKKLSGEESEELQKILFKMEE